MKKIAILVCSFMLNHPVLAFTFSGEIVNQSSSAWLVTINAQGQYGEVLLGPKQQKNGSYTLPDKSTLATTYVSSKDYKLRGVITLRDVRGATQAVSYQAIKMCNLFNGCHASAMDFTLNRPSYPAAIVVDGKHGRITIQTNYLG